MPRSSRERSIQTRENILESAYLAFMDAGYNATSMRTISEKAGVTVGAIYNHFQTKEDIWKEVLVSKHPYHQILPYFHAVEGITVASFVREVARGMVAELRKRPDLLNLMFIEIVEFKGKHIPQLVQTILPEILSLQGIFANKSGVLRDIPEPILARAFGGLFFSYYVTEIFLKAYDNLVLDDRSLDQFVDLFLYGILTAGEAQPEGQHGPEA